MLSLDRLEVVHWGENSTGRDMRSPFAVCSGRGRVPSACLLAAADASPWLGEGSVWGFRFFF